AQGDVVKVVAHADADTAGAVLKVDVLAVQQGDHTLDRQVLGAVWSSQSLLDGDGLGLLGIGRSHFAAAFGFEDQQVENISFSIGSGISAEAAALILPCNSTGCCARGSKAECPIAVGGNIPAIGLIGLC